MASKFFPLFVKTDIEVLHNIILRCVTFIYAQDLFFSNVKMYRVCVCCEAVILYLSKTSDGLIKG